MKATYEVNTNGTYVTVDVRIILHTKSNRNKKKISESHLQRFERESNQNQVELTANRRSRHDFPTEESPINRSLKR